MILFLSVLTNMLFISSINLDKKLPQYKSNSPTQLVYVLLIGPISSLLQLPGFAAVGKVQSWVHLKVVLEGQCWVNLILVLEEVYWI